MRLIFLSAWDIGHVVFTLSLFLSYLFGIYLTNFQRKYVFVSIDLLPRKVFAFYYFLICTQLMVVFALSVTPCISVSPTFFWLPVFMKRLFVYIHLGNLFQSHDSYLKRCRHGSLS